MSEIKVIDDFLNEEDFEGLKQCFHPEYSMGFQ